MAAEAENIDEGRNSQVQALFAYIESWFRYRCCVTTRILVCIMQCKMKTKSHKCGLLIQALFTLWHESENGSCGASNGWLAVCVMNLFSKKDV